MTKRRRLFALLAPTAVLSLGWLLWQARPMTALIWLVGILLGAALNRSRFCIAAAFRDVALGDTAPARALLLILGLTTLSFVSLQYTAATAGDGLPGNFYPVSAATAAGAFLFGIGMIPAGGCVGSTLVRIGEGHVRYLWTLAGLILGAVLGAYHYEWWEALAGATQPLHLPDLLGWPGAVALQVSLIALLYGLLTWWERKGVPQC